MAPFNAAGLFNHPQVAGVEDHASMGRILVNIHRITQMAGRAADQFGIVGRVKFFLGVTGQTHLNIPDRRDCKFIRPLGQRLPGHQVADKPDDKRQEDKGGNESGRRFGHQWFLKFWTIG